MNATIKTALIAVAMIAVIYRIPQAKATLTGESGGWFS